LPGLHEWGLPATEPTAKMCIFDAFYALNIGMWPDI
jgi:hypothetical protein